MQTEKVTTHVIACIRDSKAEIFLRPFVARSKADFIRSVQMETKNPESMFHKFPADYDLYILGDWSEYEGIETLKSERLGSVLDLCPLS